MLWIKLLRSLLKALNSEGTPGQVAVGIALGAVVGLTPLLSLHNLVALSAAFLLNISLPGFTLGWLLFVPVGFLLDPVFDHIGRLLLVDTNALSGFWTWLVNTPGLAWFSLNNTVVLGSLVSWTVLALPIFFLARFGIRRYRETIYQRLRKSKVVRSIMASKVYDIYRTVRP